MKKLFSLLLALAMCASLAACGGDSDTSSGGASSSPSGGTSSSTAGAPTDGQIQKLTEAYNEVAVLYNDVATKAQENGWTSDTETNTALQTIGDTLEPIGNALTGNISDLYGADFDALPDELLELKPELETLAEKVAAPFEGDATVVTDEALKPLTNAYNDLVPLFNEAYEAAEANGWLADEQTSAELDAVYAMITYIGSGLTDDPSKLEDTDLNALVEQLQPLGPAMNELAQRVSVPYEG